MDQDCDWFYRLKVLGLKYYVERKWEMTHPVPHADLGPSFDACVAAAPAAATDAARVRAAALKRMVNASTDGPTGRPAGGAPFPHPHGHREYYMRKWGAAPEDCGYGNFEQPFNDARAGVGEWTLDVARRRAFLEAEGVSIE